LRGQEVHIDEVRAAWWRRPKRIEAAASLSGYRAAQWQELLASVWLTLPCAWLPGPPLALHAAELKLYSLMKATELGLELPETMLTSSPDDVADLFERHHGRIISKLPGHSFHLTFGKEIARYTEPVTRRDLRTLSALDGHPLFFQPTIDKAIELRATVVGEQVFVAAIHSQETLHARIDWRRHYPAPIRHSVYEMPRHIAAKCVRLTQALHLRYAALDFIVTPEGRYIFLEINPNGEYGWVEDATGLPISAAIAEELVRLMNSAPRGQVNAGA
jgi:glutathione synthase/RimK-type ligase-like ATP-grasp enzyme